MMFSVAKRFHVKYRTIQRAIRPLAWISVVLLCCQAVSFYVYEVRSLIVPLVDPEDFVPVPSRGRDTAWCILDDRNTFGTRGRLFFHFPHASQALFPCWSFFRRSKREDPSVKHCGIWLNSTRLDISKGWVSDLVAKMGCSVSHSKPIGFERELSYYRPDQLNVDGFGTTWFEDFSDAAALRKRVVDASAMSKQTESSSLRIGLVQRKKKWYRYNRSISNLPSIRRGIEKNFPEAQVEIAYMEGMDLEQQAQWWSRQNVVVTAHGAQMTNLVFMNTKSAVIQLFPAHYFPVEFFGGLCRKAGISVYNWYNGVEDPLKDHERHKRTRSRYRNVDIKPPVSDVVDLVQQAVEDQRRSRERAKKI